MNDIVDVINDIISQFNESTSDGKYFRISSNTDTIFTNTETSITVFIEALDDAGDIRNVKIYWDRDGFETALNDYAETSITVTITNTTTFKATLAVSDTNNLITKTLTIKAINPTYYGSGKTAEDVVDGNGNPTSRAQLGRFFGSVSGQLKINIYRNEDLYFFVPTSVDFDTSEVYLDSILFPIEQLSTRSINGIDYKVYRSSGGQTDSDSIGFAEDASIILEVI